MDVWVSSSAQLFPTKLVCASMNTTFVDICFHFSLVAVWGTGLLGHLVHMCLIYREWPHSFQHGYAICTGISEHSSGSMWLALFSLNCCCFIGCVLVSHHGFNWYCPIGEWCVGHFFIWSLEYHFGGVVFLLIKCRCSLHILDTSPLSKSIGNILLPLVWYF